MQKTSVCFLVDDGVHGDGGLSGLAVADDQLPLAAADGRHRVDGLDTGLQGLEDGLALDDAGGLHLDAACLGGIDRALAVDRIAECIHHAAQHGLADGNLDDAVGTPHQVTLADVEGLAHHRDADVVFLEVQHHSLHIAGKLDELSGHGGLETVDARDAVAERQHGAGLGDVDLAAVLLDLALQDVGDLTGLDVHSLRSSPILRSRALGWARPVVGICSPAARRARISTSSDSRAAGAAAFADSRRRPGRRPWR